MFIMFTFDRFRSAKLNYALWIQVEFMIYYAKLELFAKKRKTLHAH